MDMPTTCPECLDVVEFDDMINIAKDGGNIFVCPDCAYEYMDDDDE